MNPLPASLALVALCCASASPAAAATIELVHTGRGSGSVGKVKFTDAAFTITAVGDTEKRLPYDTGFFIDHASATIAIEGVGVFQLMTPTRTFVLHTGNIVGFSRAGLSGGDLFDGPTTDAVHEWDMRSSIGPLSGSSNLLQWSSPAVLTHAGPLLFANAVVPGTFTARVPPSGKPAAELDVPAGEVARAVARGRDARAGGRGGAPGGERMAVVVHDAHSPDVLLAVLVGAAREVAAAGVERRSRDARRRRGRRRGGTGAWAAARGERARGERARDERASEERARDPNGATARAPDGATASLRTGRCAAWRHAPV